MNTTASEGNGERPFGIRSCISKKPNMLSRTMLVCFTFSLLCYSGLGSNISCKIRCLEENMECMDEAVSHIGSIACLITKYKCKEECYKDTIKMLKKKLRDIHASNEMYNGR